MRETIEEQNQHIGRLMEDFVRRAVEFSNTLPDRPIRQPDPQEVMDYWPWRPRNGWRATQRGRWSLPPTLALSTSGSPPARRRRTPPGTR